MTLVMVTHDEELAARADRRIYLRDGVVVGAVDARASAGTAFAS
jgi:putative ABC transport system ATP-binding protein